MIFIKLIGGIIPPARCSRLDAYLNREAKGVSAMGNHVGVSTVKVPVIGLFVRLLQQQGSAPKFKISAPFNSGTKNGSGENPKPFL